MKKKLPLLLSLISLQYNYYAQESQTFCVTDEVHREFLAANPLIKEKGEELEAFTVAFSNNPDKAPANYTIPVVFHIIHQNGPENIPDANIHEAIQFLNVDFTATNSDLSKVASSFQGIIGNAGVEFRLAKKDPNGNPTDGIDRIVSSETNVGDDGSKLNPWPNDMYLNIWVVKYVQYGGAGYTIFPQSAHYYPELDGPIVLADYVSQTYPSNYYRARTITHELGHYFNVHHPWGTTYPPGYSQNCQDDDGVSDTPNTVGWNNVCETTSQTCGSLDNVQNFMEYSYCNRMFTKGQVDRITAVLNSSTANRNKLWQTSNLIATGVLSNVHEYEVKQLQLSLSPNPAQEEINISFYMTDQKEVNIFLQDITGKRVAQIANNRSFEKGQQSIRLNDLSLKAGIYFLHFQTENIATAKKLIIQ